ncbi:MAG: phosphatase PAP2 family protein [Anaeromyxobacteraceae bacterium]
MGAPPGAVDVWILTQVNAWLGLWPRLDALVEVLVQNDLAKGGLLVGALWFVWHDPRPDRDRRRELVLATIAGALLAAVASRTLAVTLGWHARPYATAGLALQHPFPLELDRQPNAFPSDHAALAMALATGLAFVSRRLGAVAVAQVVLLVALPRLYLGLHWPSDLAAGLAIGAAASWVTCAAPVRAWLARPVLARAERAPGLFHALLFLVAFGLMTRFEDERALAGWAAAAAAGHATAGLAAGAAPRPAELRPPEAPSAEARPAAF